VRRRLLALLPLVIVPASAAPARALVVYHGPRDRPAVALTFDDAPGRDMGRILDVLAAKGARATFFVIGDQVADEPALVRRAAAVGDELGDHTWSHPRLTDLAPPAIAGELSRGSDAIAAVTGHRPVLARAPYGSWNPTVTAAMNGQGMASVWCDVATKDWTHPGVDAIRALADRAWNGSILCLHDNVDETVAALPLIIDDLRAKGLRFVTVSEFAQLLPDDSRPVDEAACAASGCRHRPRRRSASVNRRGTAGSSPSSHSVTTTSSPPWRSSRHTKTRSGRSRSRTRTVPRSPGSGAPAASARATRAATSVRASSVPRTRWR
jgi:peptidoglycan/xylan/chitin deacetylase (PgdA/CDA1 family)